MIDNIITHYTARGWMIATAESCTGGMVASAITAVSGASAIFDRGFITYSNVAKSDMLGVPPALIATHGAVSRQVAAAMAEGALHNSTADIAVAITGIAGPNGGNTEKPVGLVYIATAQKNGDVVVDECHFMGGRDDIRQHATQHALRALARFCV